MALLERETNQVQGGLQVGDKIVFTNLGGLATVTMVRGIGEQRRGLLWGDGEDAKQIIYPFSKAELQKLAALLCEAAGLRGETRVIRYEDWVCIIEIIS